MSISKRLQDFLDESQADYEVVSHQPTFSAQETAAAEHTSGKHVAKTVIMKADEKVFMVVIPATRKVDPWKVSRELGTEEVSLVKEEKFQELFPDCEVGAMPPFGELYDLDYYIDEALFKEDEIYFDGGNHHQGVRMSRDTYESISSGKMGDYTVHSTVTS